MLPQRGRTSSSHLRAYSSHDFESGRMYTLSACMPSLEVNNLMAKDLSIDPSNLDLHDRDGQLPRGDESRRDGQQAELMHQYGKIGGGAPTV